MNCPAFADVFAFRQSPGRSGQKWRRLPLLAVELRHDGRVISVSNSCTVLPGPRPGAEEKPGKPSRRGPEGYSAVKSRTTVPTSTIWCCWRPAMPTIQRRWFMISSFPILSWRAREIRQWHPHRLDGSGLSSGVAGAAGRLPSLTSLIDFSIRTTRQRVAAPNAIANGRVIPRRSVGCQQDAAQLILFQPHRAAGARRSALSVTSVQ